MNYIELQTRVNKIVEQVNSYEAALPADIRDEQELISLHKYVDTDSLKAVTQYIIDNYYEAAIPVKSQQKFFYLNFWTPRNEDQTFEGHRPLCSFSHIQTNIVPTYSFIKDNGQIYKNVQRKNGISDIDLCSNNASTSDFVALSSLVFPYSSSYQLQTNNYKQSIGFLNFEGGHLDDVLITEGQVQNLNPYYLITQLTLPNGAELESAAYIRSYGLNNSGLILITSNTKSSNSYPLFGNDNFYLTWSGMLNPIYGKPPVSKSVSDTNSTPLTYGTVGSNSNRLKIIAPMNCVHAGRSQSSSPYTGNNYSIMHNQHFDLGEFWRENNASDTNEFKVTHSTNSAYFELCFKRRRPGCKALGLDFVPSIPSIEDNDPQGLAARLALAQTKPYFDQMDVWWNELTPYYTADGYYQRRLADKIYEETKNMTDEEFIKNYKMNYETYAYATGDEL